MNIGRSTSGRCRAQDIDRPLFVELAARLSCGEHELPGQHDRIQTNEAVLLAVGKHEHLINRCAAGDTLFIFENRQLL